MTADTGLSAAALIFLLVLFAFFSAALAALDEASRTRLGELEKRGLDKATKALALLEDGGRTAGAMAVGQVLSVAAAAAIACRILLDFPPVEALPAAVLLGLVFLFFGLVLPQSLAAHRAERAAMSLAGAMTMANAILAPLVSGLTLAATGLLKTFGVNGQQDQYSVHDEVREAIDLHRKEGTVVKNDRDMLGGVLALQDLAVADIMVHRTRMTMIDAADDPKDIVAQVLKSGHTRIPVWKETPDNIVGVLHAKNLFAALQKQNGDAAKINVEDIVLPPWFVPDTRAIPDQLNAFLKRKSHFAIVVDEYGEVQGLITLEDIIEEIVGDIKDEHDAVASGVRPKPDGSYLVDGSVPIRDLNRAFDWSLPDEEANTIAGLIIHEARMIPEAGQVFIFHGFRFEILKKRRHQVTAIRITPMKRETDESAGG